MNTNVIKTTLVIMKKIWIIFFLAFFCLACQNSIQINSKITSKTNLIDTEINQDSLIIKTFTPYKEKMIKEITSVISYAPKNLVRTDGNLQSTLGNLIADLSYEKSNELFKKETGKSVDFSMSTYGGIRSGIFKGNVTVSNAFELMPFDNTFVVVEITGEKIMELFDYFLEKQRAHPLSKHVQLTIQNKKYKVTINGKKLDKNKTYFVATSNYLQKGGDNMTFFANPISLFESNFLVREGITEYFKSQDTLVSNLDNRVIIK